MPSTPKTDIDFPELSEDFAELAPFPELGSTEPLSKEDTDALLEIVMEIPAPSIDEIAEYEPDPIRRIALRRYAEGLSIEQQTALAEGLRATYGATTEVADIIHETKNLIDDALGSKMLFLRNAAAAKSLEDYNKLAQQIDRLVNGASKDNPTQSLRIDNTLGHIKELNSQLMCLSTAIYSMSARLGLHTPQNATDLPIDIELLTRLTVTIGHGAKTWAAVYANAEHTISDYKRKLADAELKIKGLMAAEDSMRLARLEQEKKELASLISASQAYYVMNRSGNYIATHSEPTEDDSHLVSAMNFYITQDPTLALKVPDLDGARRLLDAVQTWSKKYRVARRTFQEANIDPDTLFIGQLTIKQIEG